IPACCYPRQTQLDSGNAETSPFMHPSEIQRTSAATSWAAPSFLCCPNARGDSNDAGKHRRRWRSLTAEYLHTPVLAAPALAGIWSDRLDGAEAFNYDPWGDGLTAIPLREPLQYLKSPAQRETLVRGSISSIVGVTSYDDDRCRQGKRQQLAVMKESQGVFLRPDAIEHARGAASKFKRFPASPSRGLKA